MNLQDGEAPIPVGTINRHAAVEAARAQERYIKTIGTVRRGNYHYRLTVIEAIHLHQQLVERLFALIIGINTGATLSTDGINFVDKDDARGSFLCLLKQVADAAGTNTNQHFHKFRTRHREERYSSLASNCTCQQCFASSRRSNQQHAAWNLATQTLELLRRLQKLNYFLQLVLRLIHTCHISKSGTRTVFQYQLGATLAETKDALLSLRRTATEEKDSTYQEDPGQEIDQHAQPECIVGWCLVVDRCTAGNKLLGQFRITIGQLVNMVLGMASYSSLQSAGNISLPHKSRRFNIFIINLIIKLCVREFGLLWCIVTLIGAIEPVDNVDYQ